MKSVCSFCSKQTKNSFGVDLLGRIYCNRYSCNLKQKLRKLLFKFVAKLHKFADFLNKLGG